jgi:long-subunit acyl-CoA synthetase (AMP-forming)
VVGSGLKQPVALLVLREGSNKQQTELVKGLEQTLRAVNGDLESHQKLDYLLVCSAPWTIENELLTPTLKLKRGAIEASFNALLEKQLVGTVLWQQDIG